MDDQQQSKNSKKIWPGTPVRLDDSQVQSIIEAILSSIQTKVLEVSLFGSRIDLEKRGGDIDLCIEVDSLESLEPLQKTIRLLRREIQNRIGDQKIDLFVFSSNEGELSLEKKAFLELIKRAKVTLWQMHS